MHIALLDEKIADRKHLERLLDRESDRRIPTTGNLYTDSFGSVDAMFIAPKQYDFFMIDLLTDVKGCINVARRVREMNINCPICIMRNVCEAEGIDDLPDNLLWLEKPIIVAELTKTIDKVIEIEQKSSADKDDEEQALKDEANESSEDEKSSESTERQGFFKKLFGI